MTADVPRGHPNFGQAIPCPACYAPIIGARRLAALWSGTGLGAYADKSFSNFHGRKAEYLPKEYGANLKRVKDACETWAADPAGFLTLSGGYGNGKTHLAAAIANEYAAKGGHALFLVAAEFLDHLRDAFDPSNEANYSDRFNSAMSAGLLVLDDLGAERLTPWAEEKLTLLINHRYVRQSPTVVTTNLAVEELPARIASRLLDTGSCQVLVLTAPDARPHLKLHAKT